MKTAITPSFLVAIAGGVALGCLKGPAGALLGAVVATVFSVVTNHASRGVRGAELLRMATIDIARGAVLSSALVCVCHLSVRACQGLSDIGSSVSFSGIVG